MNMSLSEKIVSGLAIAVLITGFASCAFPKTAQVSPLPSSTASQCSAPRATRASSQEGPPSKGNAAMVRFILSFGIMMPVILAAISVWRS